MSEFLTVAEIAAATKLSRSAIYRAIEDGELAAHKLRGRIRVARASYEAWVSGARVTRERRDAPSFERSIPTRPRPSGTFAAKLAERRRVA